MRYRFLRNIFCGAWIGGVSVLLLAGTEASPASIEPIGSDDGQKPPVEKIAEAGAVFQKNCNSCHQPPDLKFATDRAWLDQLNRTA